MALTSERMREIFQTSGEEEMKMGFVILLAFAMTAFGESLKLGDRAPLANVKMRNVDGKELSIADIAGKNGTLVIFTCNLCPFAKLWESRLVEIGNNYQSKGVGVIAINSNDSSAQVREGAGRMQMRAQNAAYQFPYVVDATSDVARAFGAKTTPELFLFDATGKLVYHGAVDDNKEANFVHQHYLKDALDAMLAGREIAIKETKTPGCAIKLRPKM